MQQPCNLLPRALWEYAIAYFYYFYINTTLLSIHLKNMITRLIFFFFFTLIVIPKLLSQDEIQYFTDAWQETTEKNHHYKREIYKENKSAFKVLDYVNNKLEMQGFYASMEPMIPHGDFTFYHPNGKIRSSGSYCQGVICGTWKTFNKRGKITKEVNYDYTLNKCPDTKANEDEKAQKTSDNMIVVEEMPSFRSKDFQTFRKYIYSNLFFPPLMEKYRRSDRVHVQFEVDTNGEVCNVIVVHGKDEDFKQEALRVVQSATGWKPGYKKGKPVRVQFTFPIRFFCK